MLGLLHGTRSAYSNHKCRCSECRAAQAAYCRSYRSRQDPEQVRDSDNRRARQRGKERRELLNAIKMERGCADCGYRGAPEALDFDHVSDDKSFGIAESTATRSLERLLAEVEKCEVVCANCHRIRTQARRKAA